MQPLPEHLQAVWLAMLLKEPRDYDVPRSDERRRVNGRVHTVKNSDPEPERNLQQEKFPRILRPL